MAKIQNRFVGTILITCFVINLVGQNVEVQGELKVSSMATNNAVDQLVTRNPDGTLGTRAVSSLPPTPPPIDTSRNLASDLELAKILCSCPHLPPFLINSLLNGGYTTEDLLNAGIPYNDIVGASFVCGDSITYEGVTYGTVRIGGQCWMTANLNVGTMIDSSDNMSNNGMIEKYCYQNNSANCDTYGGLYQWDEIMNYSTMESAQGICPSGWHIPSDSEWKTLEIQLGMTTSAANNTGFRGSNQGSKLAGNEPLWTNGDLDTNPAFGTSGINIVPGGYRAEFSMGTFADQFVTGYQWTSSESGINAWYRSIFYFYTTVNRFSAGKQTGISVRCVKD